MMQIVVFSGRVPEYEASIWLKDNPNYEIINTQICPNMASGGYHIMITYIEK